MIQTLTCNDDNSVTERTHVVNITGNHDYRWSKIKDKKIKEKIKKNDLI